jgi:hypothetical protein
MNKMEKLNNPVPAGNLPPRYSGILKISNQVDGKSTGYPANLTGIYANEASAGIVEKGLIESPPVQYLSASPGNPVSEEEILAKFLDCARHAIGPCTKNLNTLIQLFLHMEDTKCISIVNKNL